MRKNFFTKNTSLYSEIIFGLCKKDIGDMSDPIVTENFKRLRKGEELLSKEITKQEKKTKGYFIMTNIFSPFSEISNSYESLVNISIYLHFQVPKKYVDEVTQGSYIKYSIENYLNEAYILHQRLTKYLGTIKNAYRTKEIEDKIKILLKKVNHTFTQINEIRGEHVHEIRFTDKRTDRISHFELLTKVEDKKFVRNLALPLSMMYTDTVKHWSEQIDKSLDSILELTDMYFESLIQILQDPNNKDDIIYPNDIR